MHDDSASFWADIKEYEEVLGRDPDSYLFARLAGIYLKVGLVDDALHIARQGVTRHPGYVAGQRALALACHAKGLQDECRGALEKVTLALPEDGEAQKMLGRLLSAQGNIVAAGKAFRTALEFNPDDMECRSELVALERTMAQPLTGLDDAVAAPAAEEFVGDRLDDEFGAFEDEAEEPEEIIEDLEILDMDEADLLEEGEGEESAAAPSMAGYDPLSTITLAELYVEQGFVEKGLEIYRFILEHAPDSAEVRSRIAALEDRDVVAGGLADVPDMQDWSSEEPSPTVTSAQAPAGTDDRLAVLDGWLDNIGRLKACR